MTSPHSFQLFINPNHGVPGMTVLPTGGFQRAKAAIEAWPGYAPTPLVDLPQPGVAVLRLKNEGPRFGLGSFKALGGAYAVEKLVAAESAKGNRAITVTCATDGNHGRSVAWGAQRAGCRCVIFVHETVSQGRVDAIAAYGARVIRVPGNYDDSVREADRQAQANHWFVVSDTSYPGYTEVPRDVMQGYRVMADEAADQWTGPPPTHVFMQAGVGGAAAAVSVQMRARFDPAPRLVIVEPETAACLYESARAAKPVTVGGNLDTIMAGLACGEPSLLAWQELERAAFAFMTIPDSAAADTLRDLANRGLEIGESGVAGLAALRLVITDHDSMFHLNLNDASRIVVFGTEGVTDRYVYEGIRSETAS
jgi:diaminopropionate ammonia-lyase